MSGKPGMRSTLPTQLPPRYKRGFAWKMNGSTALARELSGTIGELIQHIGGVEALTLPALLRAERVAYLDRRLRDHETAVLRGDKGIYSESEHLTATLALDRVLTHFGMARKAKPTQNLHDVMRSGGPSVS